MKTQKGFTLVELIIAVAIAAIVIGTVLTELDKRNYNLCGFSCK